MDDDNNPRITHLRPVVWAYSNGSIEAEVVVKSDNRSRTVPCGKYRSIAEAKTAAEDATDELAQAFVDVGACVERARYPTIYDLQTTAAPEKAIDD